MRRVGRKEKEKVSDGYTFTQNLLFHQESFLIFTIGIVSVIFVKDTLSSFSFSKLRYKHQYKTNLHTYLLNSKMYPSESYHLAFCKIIFIIIIITDWCFFLFFFFVSQFVFTFSFLYFSFLLYLLMLCETGLLLRLYE